MVRAIWLLGSGCVSTDHRRSGLADISQVAHTTAGRCGLTESIGRIWLNLASDSVTPVAWGRAPPTGQCRATTGQPGGGGLQHRLHLRRGFERATASGRWR